MSDFLTNLVGRSLGTLAVVKPRIPSIYEPYRRGSGLSGVRQSVVAADASLGSSIEPAPGVEPSPTNISHQNSNLPLQASRPAEPEGQFSPAIPPPAPQDASREAQAVQSARARREALAAMPIPAAANSGVTIDQALAQPGGTLPITRPTGGELGSTADAARSLADARHGSHGGPVYPPQLPDTTATRRDVLAASPRATDHPDDKNPLSTRLDRPPAAPALVAQNVSSIPSAIRPPLASRPAEMPRPTPLPPPGPAQNSIQVSIGRVEVRAVFPEPVARPSPVPRSRPTVSLDDYLKQSSRGKR